ncbi:IS66 family transposase [Mesorhizobium sp. 131-2-5]|uniref:IS66 family transposase n=1 Tax=Mesorhizobium sp. 131-2-5 TaxID=2744519 RepID=UPI00406D4DF3
MARRHRRKCLAGQQARQRRLLHLNQWEYLTRYTEDGSMLIDNNLLERDIRIFATGRKFSDTADRVRASAIVYSLVLT